MAVPYSTRPRRFAYQLTEAGRALGGAVRLLAQWSADHGDGGADTPAHAECGTPLVARWWCPTCDRPSDAGPAEVPSGSDGPGSGRLGSGRATHGGAWPDPSTTGSGMLAATVMTSRHFQRHRHTVRRPALRAACDSSDLPSDPAALQSRYRRRRLPVPARCSRPPHGDRDPPGLLRPVRPATCRRAPTPGEGSSLAIATPELPGPRRGRPPRPRLCAHRPVSSPSPTIPGWRSWQPPYWADRSSGCRRAIVRHFDRATPMASRAHVDYSYLDRGQRPAAHGVDPPGRLPATDWRPGLPRGHPSHGPCRLDFLRTVRTVPATPGPSAMTWAGWRAAGATLEVG